MAGHTLSKKAGLAYKLAGLVLILILATGFGLWHHWNVSRYMRPPGDPGYSNIVNEFMAGQPMAVNVSPDGKYLLVKTEYDRGYKISVLDRNTGREIVSSFSKCSQLALTWRPDSKAVAFQEMADMDRPLYLLDIQTGVTSKMLAPISQSALLPLRWNPACKRLAYYQGDWRKGRLMVVSPGQDNQPIVVRHPLSGTCDFVWSPDGTRIALTAASYHGEIAVITMRDLKQYSFDIPNAEIRDLAWSPDGNLILFTARRKEDEFFKLFQIDVMTRTMAAKAQAAGDIGQPVWMPDSKAFIYHVSSNGITRAFLCSLSSSAAKLIGPTNGVLHITHPDPGGKFVYAHFSGLTTPPVLGQISVDDGTWKVLYACPNPEGCRCPEPEFITIQCTNGDAVPAYHWPAPLPEGAERSALIMVHGGDHTQTYPVWESYIRVVTGMGCDVIAENHRSSSGYGKNYEQLRGGMAAEDIIATRDYAAKVLKVKPQRIFLAGLSTGSRLIAEAAARGVETGGLILMSWPGPKPPVLPCFAHSVPVLEFHGQLDAILSPGDARRTVEKYFAGGQEPFKIQYFVFENEPHFFYRAQTRAAIYWELSKLLRSSN